MDDLRDRINDLRSGAIAEQRLFKAVCDAFAAYQNATAEEKDAARERCATLIEQFSQLIRPNHDP